MLDGSSSCELKVYLGRGWMWRVFQQSKESVLFVLDVGNVVFKVMPKQMKVEVGSR